MLKDGIMKWHVQYAMYNVFNRNMGNRSKPVKLVKRASKSRPYNVMMISQPTLSTLGHYSHLRKLLVLWICPSTSVIHTHNLSSHFCLLICFIHLCCITKIGLVVFNVQITVSAIYLAL